jgi:multicomponent Na+:H+ antiporter subunit B
MSKKIIVFILFVLFIILSISIIRMPDIGGVKNPAYNEVTTYYLENAQRETGSMNIIAAIITDYRAFDTLGETTVLFSGIAAVFSVLSMKGDKHE